MVDKKMNTVTSLMSKRRKRASAEALNSIVDMAEHLRTCEGIIDAVNTIARIEDGIETFLSIQCAELMMSEKSVKMWLDAAKQKLREGDR